MRILRSFLAASLLCSPLAACGDDGGGDAPDASVPDTMPPEPLSVTIHAQGAKLLAIREGLSGEWRALTPGANGDATAEVARGPYAITSVCDEPGFFDDYLILAGPTDTTEHLAACSDGLPPPIAVPITSDAEVDVRIGFRRARNGVINVSPGTYDVVAIERNAAATPRFVIRRDVVIAADSTLNFDLATDGTAMRSATVTADIVASEAANPFASLSTARGTTITAPPNAEEGKVWLFPVASLAAGDKQRVTVTAQHTDDSPGTRSARKLVTTDVETVALTLPPPITAASATWNGALSVTWTATGTWGERYAFALDADLTHLWDIKAYSGWFAAGGDDDSLTMPEPTTLPGWKAEWNQLDAAGFEWTVWFDHALADGAGESTDWTGAFATPAANAATSRPLPELLQRRLAR